MIIIKCKMCGGDIQRMEEQTYGTCDSCGGTMTFPKVPDELRVNLFNRANHFRMQGEFDKAIAAYESILNQDDTDAEAHWGAVLSRYGIEYVEDPVSHDRVPTCNRVQLDSILSDADYLAALENAPDGYSRSLYEEEAKKIAEIQRGILALSSQESPYDVFICYKERTDSGTRTQDSALAQDVYYQLTQEGYKVFFSRITLEEKLGQQYEPYIFAALNSARVMVVIGTKPEYFNAVWVKNEWSRFLAVMKKDRSRLLIPCYRGMDAYDLPEELSMLQSQDMGKIGFLQDLVRGVKKVIESERANQQSGKKAESGSINHAPANKTMLKRALLLMEDNDWKSADEILDKVLLADPEDGEAYLYKALIKLRLSDSIQIVHSEKDLSEIPELKRAIQFLPAQESDSLKKAIEINKKTKEENRRKVEEQLAFNVEIDQLMARKTSLNNQIPTNIKKRRILAGFIVLMSMVLLGVGVYEALTNKYFDWRSGPPFLIILIILAGVISFNEYKQHKKILKIRGEIDNVSKRIKTLNAKAYDQNEL